MMAMPTPRPVTPRACSWRSPRPGFAFASRTARGSNRLGIRSAGGQTVRSSNTAHAASLDAERRSSAETLQERTSTANESPEAQLGSDLMKGRQWPLTSAAGGCRAMRGNTVGVSRGGKEGARMPTSAVATRPAHSPLRTATAIQLQRWRRAGHTVTSAASQRKGSMRGTWAWYRAKSVAFANQPRRPNVPLMRGNSTPRKRNSSPKKALSAQATTTSPSSHHWPENSGLPRSRLFA